MALSQPRTIFGVHSASPYNVTTGLPYGILKVLGGSSVSLSGELVKLNGGSFKYPWAIEEGNITSEISLKVKQYEDFMIELFLGKPPTATGADATGTVSAITDKYGGSLVDAVTGVASVGIIPTTGAANLKFGKYVAKVTAAAVLSIYTYSDIDFARGTDENYDSDDLLVQSGVTITSGGNTDVASLGLRFVGGSGTIGMTVGDTATFEVKEPSSKSMTVAIGSLADVFPEFGLVMLAKKRGNLEMFEIDAHRCKGIGLPIGLEENSWSEAEIKVEAFYDATLDRVLSIRHITPTS